MQVEPSHTTTPFPDLLSIEILPQGGDTALDTVIAACDCQPHWTQQQAKHGGLNRSLLPMSALAGDQTS